MEINKNKEDEIINQMSKLYIMFCVPQVKVSEQTGKIISMGNIWINKEAEENFSKLAELFLHYKLPSLKL